MAMSDTAYYINRLAKNALAISDNEWGAMLSNIINTDLRVYFALVEVKVSVELLRKSLDFTEEAEQVAEEVTA